MAKAEVRSDPSGDLRSDVAWTSRGRLPGNPGPGKVRWAPLLAVVLLFAACGGGDGEGRTPAGGGTSDTATTGSDGSATTTGSDPSSATTAPPGTTSNVTTAPGSGGGTGPGGGSPQAQSEQSLLQRRDAPPSGIRSQFEFFQEGNGFCRGLPSGPPRALVEVNPVEIGQFFAICFPDFVKHRPVNAEVTLPNGDVRRSLVTDIDTDGVAYWAWSALPGDPLGAYGVSATQDAVRGTGTFTVNRASRPGILVPPPHLGPPGTTFRLAIFGFEPNEMVPVYVYRTGTNGGGGLYDFVTTLSVPVDAEGQAIYELRTRADDPRGTYCFLHRGPKAAPTYACGGLASIYLQ